MLLSHTLEPMLRKYGVPTRLAKGKIMLENEKGHVICKEGEVLGAAQTALLKAFGVEASLFGVRIMGWWGEDIGCHLEKDDKGPLKRDVVKGVGDAAAIDTNMDVDDVDGGADCGAEELGEKKLTR